MASIGHLSQPRSSIKALIIMNVIKHLEKPTLPPEEEIPSSWWLFNLLLIGILLATIPVVLFSIAVNAWDNWTRRLK